MERQENYPGLSIAIQNLRCASINLNVLIQHIHFFSELPSLAKDALISELTKEKNKIASACGALVNMRRVKEVEEIEDKT